MGQKRVEKMLRVAECSIGATYGIHLVRLKLTLLIEEIELNGNTTGTPKTAHGTGFDQCRLQRVHL